MVQKGSRFVHIAWEVVSIESCVVVAVAVVVVVVGAVVACGADF